MDIYVWICENEIEIEIAEREHTQNQLNKTNNKSVHT